MADPHSHTDNGLMSPLAILNLARRQVPAVNYALGLAGLGAAGSVVVGLLGHGRAAIVTIGLVFVGSVLLFIFARLIASRNKSVNTAGIALIWAITAFFIVFLVFTATSVAVGWPPMWTKVLNLPADQQTLTSPFPTKRDFVLRPNFSFPDMPGRAYKIAILPIDIPQWLDTQDIRIVSAKPEVGALSDARWAEPVSVMVRELLVDAFQAAQYDTNIDPPAGFKTDFFLKVSVESFEANLDDMTVHVRIKVVVWRTDKQAAAARATFERREQFVGREMEEIVSAFKDATYNVLKKVVIFAMHEELGERNSEGPASQKKAGFETLSTTLAGCLCEKPPVNHFGKWFRECCAEAGIPKGTRDIV